MDEEGNKSKIVNIWIVLVVGTLKKFVWISANKLHFVQTDFGAHSVPYPMRTGGSFPGSKASGAWNWPLASN
jgi:hypothetical protein